MTTIGKKNYVLTFLAVLSSMLALVVLVMAASERQPTRPEKNNVLKILPGLTAINGADSNLPSRPHELITIQPSAQPSNQVAPPEDIGGPEYNLVVSAYPEAVPAGDRVRFKIDRFKKLALQLLQFEVFDERGKALKPDDLKIVNEYRMHFLVVSADLKQFQHVYPYFENGKWKVLAYMPTPGTYYAYIDIAPLKGNPLVLRKDLIVQKASPATLAYPEVTAQTRSSTEGEIAGGETAGTNTTEQTATQTGSAAAKQSFTTRLSINSNLQTVQSPFTVTMQLGDPHLLRLTTFSFQVTQDGKEAKLQTFMGAPGHLVIFRQGDPKGFSHVHALETSRRLHGNAEFATTFSQAGRYTGFAEFTINGKKYAFPVTFEIIHSQ